MYESRKIFHRNGDGKKSAEHGNMSDKFTMSSCFEDLIVFYKLFHIKWIRLYWFPYTSNLAHVRQSTIKMSWLEKNFQHEAKKKTSNNLRQTCLFLITEKTALCLCVRFICILVDLWLKLVPFHRNEANGTVVLKLN